MLPTPPLPGAKKEHTSPRISIFTQITVFKSELPRTRVAEGATQCRGDWANLTQEYVPVICTRHHIPTQEPF